MEGTFFEQYVMEMMRREIFIEEVKNKIIKNIIFDMFVGWRFI